jgi:drug/metabolite transporter (DMT)-like permease
MSQQWIFYAFGAAILWGSSYAASGPILRSKMAPLVFYFCYSCVGVLVAALLLILSGKRRLLMSELSELNTREIGWFLFSLVSASLGAWMTYLAVEAKNASLASMIEISYPLFVVLFTWIFFREIQLSGMTFLGGILVIAGVCLIIKNSV